MIHDLTTADRCPNCKHGLNRHLLAGEVDGTVDELAACILASPWLARRDARIRAEALRETADTWRGGQTHRPVDAPADGIERWLRGLADRIEREGQR